VRSGRHITTGYRLRILICGPHLYSIHGIGSIISDKNPRRLVAHPVPSTLYTENHSVSGTRNGDQDRDFTLTLNSKKRKDSTERIPHDPIRRKRRRAILRTVNVDTVQHRGYLRPRQLSVDHQFKPTQVSRTNKHRFPHANGTAATTSTAQCFPAFAAQPNQNSPTGMPKLPTIALHNLCSGCA
jgi:hypothetical protein